MDGLVRAAGGREIGGRHPLEPAIRKLTSAVRKPGAKALPLGGTVLPPKLSQCREKESQLSWME